MPAQAQVTANLVRFANTELVPGSGGVIESDTPVLEMGILDSLSMVALLTYIQTHVGVSIPDEEVLPENFETLGKLGELVVRLRDIRPSRGLACPNALEESVRILEGSGIRRRWIEIDSGARLHVLEVDGSGPTLVLLPGLGNPASSWGSVLQSVRGDRVACAVDLLGFGFSTGPNDAPGYREQADAVETLMKTLEPPFILVGSSAGALIGAEIVRRRPEWLTAFVVTGFGLVPDPPAWWRDLLELSGSPERFLQAAYYRPPRLTKAVDDLVRGVVTRPAYLSFLSGNGLESMTRIFEGIRVPTLFVCGEMDRIILPEWVRAAAAQVPGARLEMLARCGHFPPAEQPEELVHTIGRFLTRLL